MQRLMKVTFFGWATLDALLALGLWSTLGLGLIWHMRTLWQAQSQLGQQALAAEWQADIYERLHLAGVRSPMLLEWGQKVSGGDCTQTDCDPVAWRDSLMSDWQTRMQREWPLAQAWLSPWSGDGRLQVVGLRWPERGQPAQALGVNGQTCPVDWRCVIALGWP